MTTPPLVIVATPVDPDTHGLTAFGVPEPVKVVVPPIHALRLPEIVGGGLTVIVNVFEQPLVFV